MAKSRSWAGSGGGNVGINPWRDWESDLSIIRVQRDNILAATCRA